MSTNETAAQRVSRLESELRHAHSCADADAADDIRQQLEEARLDMTVDGIDEELEDNK